MHNDHLGTPQKLTDNTGALVWDRIQTPFGLDHSVTGPAATPVRFPGQYADGESGLSYNYSRDYDPRLGRYIQSDSIGLRGGLNTFGYANQNPMMFIDPLGTLPAAALCASGVYPTIGKFIVDVITVCIGAIVLSSDSTEEDESTAKRPPPGSRPISQTEWSGDHQAIKEAIGAGPADSTKIDPDGNVWGQNEAGTWTNHGPAETFTGSGKPSGRQGKDRKRR